MKTRATSVISLLGCILLAGSAMAQIHGVPASATSLGPSGFTGRNFSPGIPASATSLGPRGFIDGQRFIDEQLITTFDGRRIRAARLGRHFQPFFIPLMYSPFYYEMTALPEAPAQYYPSQSQQSVAMPAKLEITIVDKRENPASSKASSADASSKQAIAPPAPAPEELATKTLVMRDGSKKEIRSYAIVGKNLFDLSDSRSRRIPLDDIDVAATTKVNEDNGVDFKLP